MNTGMQAVTEAGTVTTRQATDADCAAWNAYVLAHRDGSFFHRFEWFHVMREALAHAPHFLVAERDGTLVGLAFGFSHAVTAADEVPKVEFSFAYLNDMKNVDAGREIWQQQCRHCHGASAYPGKAPKLKPRKYTPEFVFKRTYKGTPSCIIQSH